jgi:hypothetical protein
MQLQDCLHVLLYVCSGMDACGHAAYIMMCRPQCVYGFLTHFLARVAARVG